MLYEGFAEGILESSQRKHHLVRNVAIVCVAETPVYHSNSLNRRYFSPSVCEVSAVVTRFFLRVDSIRLAYFCFPIMSCIFSKIFVVSTCVTLISFPFYLGLSLSYQHLSTSPVAFLNKANKIHEGSVKKLWQSTQRLSTKHVPSPSICALVCRINDSHCNSYNCLFGASPCVVVPAKYVPLRGPPSRTWILNIFSHPFHSSLPLPPPNTQNPFSNHMSRLCLSHGDDQEA